MMHFGVKMTNGPHILRPAFGTLSDGGGEVPDAVRGLRLPRDLRALIVAPHGDQDRLGGLAGLEIIL